VTRSRALLVALAMAVALIAGAFPEFSGDPRRYLAFTSINVALLAAALWVALPAIGGAACLLIFAGPTLWWIDKPTIDIFVFAALTMALVALGSAEPKGSAFANATADSPEPWRRRSALRTAGASLALLIVVIQPAFGRSLHWPALAEWLAVPFDPSIGLVANVPVLALAVVLAIGVLVSRRAFAIPSDHAAALLAGVVLLFTIAQVTDQHGDTPSISRYANWMIPLSVPFLRQAHALGGARYRRTLWGFAGASAMACTLLFHPAAKPSSREPTLAANFLWMRHPAWNNPLPEIFSEVLHPGETRVVPAATAQCEKLLLVGGADGTPMFPAPCFPAEAPQACASAGALCYANRDGAGYQFVRAPGSAAHHQGFTAEPRLAWPAASTARVRDLFTRWEWWTMRPNTGGGSVLRENHAVRVMELEGARRHVFVLRQATPGARIALRLPWKATGALIDPMSGQTLRALEFSDEPLSRWELDVPPGFDVLLMFIQAI
jgi:hypothetical protein